MADWGLNHLKTIAPDEIVDIGCGGGRNAEELLKRYGNPETHSLSASHIIIGLEGDMKVSVNGESSVCGGYFCHRE